MVKKESFQINGRNFIRTYSDAGRYVVRDGISYSEACDPAEFNRQYTEGNVIDEPDGEAEEIVNILIGEAE